MKSLYTIIFEDLTTYRGGDYSNSGWLNIPDKKIKRIIYNLSNGDNLVLNSYDSYYHCIEGTTDINIKSKQPTKMEFTYLMGRKNEIITCYRINIETGNIKKKIYKETDKFILRLNKIGWKGIKNKEDKKC